MLASGVHIKSKQVTYAGFVSTEAYEQSKLSLHPQSSEGRIRKKKADKEAPLIIEGL